MCKRPFAVPTIDIKEMREISSQDAYFYPDLVIFELSIAIKGEKKLFFSYEESLSYISCDFYYYFPFLFHLTDYQFREKMGWDYNKSGAQNTTKMFDHYCDLDDDESEKISDEIELYRDVKLSGGYSANRTLVPEIYIVCYDGYAEISSCDKDFYKRSWSYYFDPNLFVQSTHRTLLSFLHKQVEKTEKPFLKQTFFIKYQLLKSINPKWMRCCCSKEHSPRILALSLKNKSKKELLEALIPCSSLSGKMFSPLDAYHRVLGGHCGNVTDGKTIAIGKEADREDEEVFGHLTRIYWGIDESVDTLLQYYPKLILPAPYLYKKYTINCYAKVKEKEKSRNIFDHMKAEIWGSNDYILAPAPKKLQECDPFGLYFLGHAYIQFKEKEQAKKEWENLLSLHPPLGLRKATQNLLKKYCES